MTSGTEGIEEGGGIRSAIREGTTVQEELDCLYGEAGRRKEEKVGCEEEKIMEEGKKKPSVWF